MSLIPTETPPTTIKPPKDAESIELIEQLRLMQKEAAVPSAQQIDLTQQLETESKKVCEVHQKLPTVPDALEGEG